MAKQKTENEEYKRLLEKHEALNSFTDEALDRRREWFIQEVINHYDMVEIGTLYFGDMAIDVESIYYDKTEHTGIRGNEVPRRRTDVAGHDD